jgi:hypothetical protein
MGRERGMEVDPAIVSHDVLPPHTRRQDSVLGKGI